MRAILFFVFAFLLLGMGSRPAKLPEEVVKPVLVEEVLKPIEVAAYSGPVKISRSTQFGSDLQNSKILAAIQKAEEIMNSEAFKQRVLSSRFTSTKDSSEVILDRILSSNKQYSEVIWVFERHRSRKVLGWTYASEKRIWFNNRNFDTRTQNGLTGTVCHELMHKIGYDHRSARDLMSVPYSLGTICSQLYKD